MERTKEIKRVKQLWNKKGWVLFAAAQYRPFADKELVYIDMTITNAKPLTEISPYWQSRDSNIYETLHDTAKGQKFKIVVTAITLGENPGQTKINLHLVKRPLIRDLAQATRDLRSERLQSASYLRGDSGVVSVVDTLQKFEKSCQYLLNRSNDTPFDLETFRHTCAHLSKLQGWTTEATLIMRARRETIQVHTL